jgi:hypothetical protein
LDKPYDTPYINDPGIVRARAGDIPLIVPQLQQKLLKAAIIPHTHTEAFKRAAATIDHGLLSALSDEQSFRYDFNRHAFIPEGGLNRTIATQIQNTPILWSQIQRAVYALKGHEHREDEIFINVFSALPETQELGIVPAFHQDTETAAHITICGAGLEFITGPLTPEEESTLDSIWFEDKHHHRLDDLPQWKIRIQTANAGDMVLFDEDFYHRSTSKIWAEGRLAVIAYTPWPL